MAKKHTYEVWHNNIQLENIEAYGPTDAIALAMIRRDKQSNSTKNLVKSEHLLRSTAVLNNYCRGTDEQL